MMDDTHAAFWALVQTASEDDCWLWKAGKTSAGYGAFYVQRRQILAHRLAIELHTGTAVPKGVVVRHKCDNPACVNPSHLVTGSQRDNVHDAITRGRSAKPPVHSGENHWRARFPDRVLKGSDVPSAKLTEGDVLNIRQLRMSGAAITDLATSYELDFSTVADICNGKTWKHVFDLDGCPTIESLLSVPGNRTPGAKITAEDAAKIKELLNSGLTGREIARMYGVHFATISDIRTGKTWKAVKPSISSV
jgi:hypothetical protein